MSFISELISNNSIDKNRDNEIIDEQMSFVKKMILNASRNKQTNCVYTPFCNDFNCSSYNVFEFARIISERLKSEGIFAIPYGAKVYINWESLKSPENNDNSLTIQKEIINSKSKKQPPIEISILKYKTDYGVDNLPINTEFLE